VRVDVADLVLAVLEQQRQLLAATPPRLDRRVERVPCDHVTLAVYGPTRRRAAA
jgi:hypothetical protein